jgi:20S proteasome subunit beta 1
MVESKYSLGGSGSGYIYGYVDANYRDNMSLEEAHKLVLHAVSHAIARDGSSGGVCRIINITEKENTREFIEYKKLPYKL